MVIDMETYKKLQIIGFIRKIVLFVPFLFFILVGGIPFLYIRAVNHDRRIMAIKMYKNSFVWPALYLHCQIFCGGNYNKQIL
jgi:hypothetical protein